MVRDRKVPLWVLMGLFVLLTAVSLTGGTMGRLNVDKHVITARTVAEAGADYAQTMLRTGRPIQFPYRSPEWPSGGRFEVYRAGKQLVVLGYSGPVCYELVREVL